MRAVHLDFLHPNARPGKLAWWLFGTGALVLALAAGVTLFVASDIEEETAASRDRLSKAREAIAAKKPKAMTAGGQNVPEEWNRAIKLAGVLNSPWAGMFSMLEGEIDRPVKPLSLEADAGRQELAITAEAKKLDDMLSFINFLKERDFLADVVLHSHQVNQQDNDKPVRFRVTARWVNK